MEGSEWESVFMTKKKIKNNQTSIPSIPIAEAQGGRDDETGREAGGKRRRGGRGGGGWKNREHARFISEPSERDMDHGSLVVRAASGWPAATPNFIRG